MSESDVWEVETQKYKKVMYLLFIVVTLIIAFLACTSWQSYTFTAGTSGVVMNVAGEPLNSTISLKNISNTTERVTRFYIVNTGISNPYINITCLNPNVTLQHNYASSPLLYGEARFIETLDSFR